MLELEGARANTRYQRLQDEAGDFQLTALDSDSVKISFTSLDVSGDARVEANAKRKASDHAKLDDEEYDGAAVMEGVVAVWGKWGKWCLIVGMALMIITFELDNSTTSTYETYAMSEFRTLSMGGTLDVIGSLVSASVKIPIAKISDVIGRGETYCVMTMLLVVSYILHAGAGGFPSFVIGSLFYLTGSAGIGLLDFIVVSDITSMRSRALAGNLLYSPYIMITWLSGIIVDKVKDSIGWRWGYGMFVFIMPIGSALLLVTLLHLQRKARKAGYAVSRKTTLKAFCSRIDIGGSLLLTTGFGCILLPITLAAQSHDHWKSAWVTVLILLGIFLLICLVPYEALVARHPVVPVSYFRMRAIMVAFLVMSVDACGYRITHTYLFAFSIATHNYSTRTAMYLSYISGLTQLCTGIVVGMLIYRLRSYKWMSVGGSLIRAFGYGMMIRVRTNSGTTLELFITQMIQGLGSGFLETSMFVAAQIMVPHAELAQVTALIAMAAHMGGGIGSAVAGGIYTTSMKGRLRARLGPSATETEIEDLYDSITGTLPTWGSEERTAVAAAYSDVIGYMTVVALYVALPAVILALIMPNNKLKDGKNLREAVDEDDDDDDLDIDEPESRRAEMR